MFFFRILFNILKRREIIEDEALRCPCPLWSYSGSILQERDVVEDHALALTTLAKKIIDG